MKNIIFLAAAILSFVFLTISCGDTGKKETGDTGNSGDTGDSGNTANDTDTSDSGNTGNTGDTVIIQEKAEEMFLYASSDSEGNIFVTGYNSEGEETIDFIKKYSKNYDLIWTKPVVYKNEDQEEKRFYEAKIKIDENNDIILVADGIFISKWDNDGNILWEKIIGTDGDDSFLRSFDLDKSGNIYVAGSTTDAFEGYEFQGKSDDTTDIFLFKLSKDGELMWVNQWGTVDTEYPTALAISSDNEIYISEKLVLGSSDGGTDRSTMDIFLSKVNGTTGDKEWSKHWGSDTMDIAFGVVVDTSGDVYISGLTRGSLDDITPPYSDAEVGDMEFLTKLDSDGEVYWTKQWLDCKASPGKGYPHSLSIDSNDNLYIGSACATELVYVEDDKEEGGGYYDVVFDIALRKIDKDGSDVWFKKWDSGGPGDWLWAIDIGYNDSVYLTGYADGSLDNAAVEEIRGPFLIILK